MTNPNNNNDDQLRDWDVITATIDGGVVSIDPFYAEMGGQNSADSHRYL